ncbi:MAG: hypothetical protein IJM79_05810 [Erysipelotrichaceae bacterium]|nr:hypothetical protein [Erysipelotrichaceae bacterium]
MDLLFAEAALTDPGFGRLLIDKTDLAGKPFTVTAAELSKSDSKLGESDITLIMDINGVRHGFLIEDKIDAIAMPSQHDRYVSRGKKGIRSGDYESFRIFIICPRKYAESDEEANLYEHILTYEECRDYFAGNSDPLSCLRSRQLDQAISKAKKPPTGQIDEKANEFLRQYISYQKEHYPFLDLSTGEDRNGWWTQYRTELGSVYINHKMREGHVDLTFPKAADKSNQARIIADWIRDHGVAETSVVKTKKSVMIRVNVPRLDIQKGLEAVNRDELDQCFQIISRLADFANMIAMTASIVSR